MSTKKIFDLKALKQEFETAEADFCVESGVYVKRVYLGTCFALLPSGKYYMPFACSNVEPCNACKGSGLSKRTVGCHICGATGLRITTDRISESFRQENNLEMDMLFDCVLCHGTGGVHRECGWCGGVGSREAYLDQCWYKRAERELDRIGASIESGEGDPCDLFAVMSVEVETLGTMDDSSYVVQEDDPMAQQFVPGEENGNEKS